MRCAARSRWPTSFRSYGLRPRVHCVSGLRERIDRSLQTDARDEGRPRRRSQHGLQAASQAMPRPPVLRRRRKRAPWSDSYTPPAMAKVCAVCGKKPGFGHNRSHSMVATKRRFEPNLQRVLPDDDSAPRKVRIRQEGEMWLKPGGRRLRFTAVEDFAVQEVAFSWRAAFPIAPLITLRIVDRYGA